MAFKMTKPTFGKSPVEMASPLPKLETQITYPSGNTNISTGTESVTKAQKIAANTAKVIAAQRKRFLEENPEAENDDGSIEGFTPDLSNQPTVDLSGAEAKEFYSGARNNVTSEAGKIYKTDNPTTDMEDIDGNAIYDKYNPQDLISQSGGTLTTDLDDHQYIGKDGIPYPPSEKIQKELNRLYEANK